ncbi:SKP1-like protein 1A [Malania oleifera]|uniref:SKP1-like protein 1A n=1 Tax=Malania oleifera TaxID=397392 RepID=UPI0025ADFC7B|nr:SKP1-like protein 1A [Malania oleifera]
MGECSESVASEKKLRLKASDGIVFEVEENVAMESETIKLIFLEDVVSREAPVPLPNVSGKILAKVLEFCKVRAELRPRSDFNEKIKDFKKDFAKDEDDATLIALLNAANYLNINDLLDLLCQKVADLIKDKSVEEVRQFFGIEGDFTPEEEEEIRKEHDWAFQ